MIKINDINFGFAPYGSASGLLVFTIDIKSDDIGYDELDGELKDIEYYTDTQEENKVNRNFWYPKIGELLYKQVVDIIVDKGMEDFWEDALLSKHFIFFTGEGILNPTNINFFNSLVDMISKYSLEPQKEKFKEYSDYIIAHNGQQPNWQPLPPKLGICFKPDTFTGMDDFYPQFNLVYIPIQLYDENNELLKDLNNINIFSLIEMMRNPFSVFIVKIKNIDEMNTFVKLYLESDELPISRDRTFVVLDEYKQDIIDIIVEQKLRFNITLKGDDVLETI